MKTASLLDRLVSGAKNLTRLRAPVGFLALFVLLPLLAPSASAGEVKVLREWKGKFRDAADEVLMKAAPESGIIGSKDVLGELWQTWRLEGPAPDVDFTEQLILVGTTGCAGNAIGGSFSVDEKGDLQGGFMATQMACPGFAYAILLIDRGGIKTFEGRKILANGTLAPPLPQPPPPGPQSGAMPGASPGTAPMPGTGKAVDR
jgi:hypothetical protein